MFGFELPQQGYVSALACIILLSIQYIFLSGSVALSYLSLPLFPQRQIVSSYKGKFGYVQYFVKALMERPAQPALECKKHFEVEEPLDVNTPDLLVSSSLTYHKA
jgi:hypothetical protein